MVEGLLVLGIILAFAVVAFVVVAAAVLLVRVITRVLRWLVSWRRNRGVCKPCERLAAMR